MCVCVGGCIRITCGVLATNTCSLPVPRPLPPPAIAVLPRPQMLTLGACPQLKTVLLRATVLGQESKLTFQGATGGTYLLSEKPQKKIYVFSSISRGCIYPKNCYVLILQTVSLTAIRGFPLALAALELRAQTPPTERKCFFGSPFIIIGSTMIRS